MGYAPAQARFAFAHGMSGEECFEWAQRAAVQGDREGLYLLGVYLSRGRSCQVDPRKFAQCFKTAAQLGRGEGQLCYGLELAEEDPEGQAITCEAFCEVSWVVSILCDAAIWHLKAFDEGDGFGPCVFEIGAACKGHVDATDKIAFGVDLEMTGIEAMRRAVMLYDKWCEQAKHAIDCWSGIARRNCVVKVVRVMIARIVWDERRAWSSVGRGR